MVARGRIRGSIPGVAMAAVLALAGCTGGATPVTSTPGVPTSTAPASPSAGPTTPGAVERMAVRVVSAREDAGAFVLTADPVEWLTGEAAAEAAAARGDESPPPNDFYIVNDDPTPVDLPVDSGVVVSTVMDAEGVYCDDMTCPGMALADWGAAIEGPARDTLLSTPYWLTVAGGVVTAIDQQYVP